MTLSPTDPRHGEPRGYIAGCREDCCRGRCADCDAGCRPESARCGPCALARARAKSAANRSARAAEAREARRQLHLQQHQDAEAARRARREAELAYQGGWVRVGSVLRPLAPAHQPSGARSVWSAQSKVRGAATRFLLERHTTGRST